MAATSGVRLPTKEEDSPARAGQARSQVLREEDRKGTVRFNGEGIYHLEAAGASRIVSLFLKEVCLACIFIVHSLTQETSIGCLCIMNYSKH